MLSHYSPAKSICQRSFCDQSANLFAYKCTALTLIVLNVVVSLCFNIQCLFVYGWLSADLLLSTTTGPSLTLGCTISVGISCVCVCLSVWYSSSAPTASSFGPSVNKDYQETAQWKMHLGVFFFPPQSQRGGLMCSSATTQRRSHHSVWASHRRPQKEIHFTLAVTCVSCPFEMDDSSYSHRRLCRGGVRSCARGCVCSACVCVCAGMEGRAHEGRDGRAAEIIHFVRRQDKCRESRFSHFLLPCLSLVLFLGPVFCIVVIRPTACESISTQ